MGEEDLAVEEVTVEEEEDIAEGLEEDSEEDLAAEEETVEEEDLEVPAIRAVGVSPRVEDPPAMLDPTPDTAPDARDDPVDSQADKAVAGIPPPAAPPSPASSRPGRRTKDPGSRDGGREGFCSYLMFSKHDLVQSHIITVGRGK